MQKATAGALYRMHALVDEVAEQFINAQYLCILQYYHNVLCGL